MKERIGNSLLQQRLVSVIKKSKRKKEGIVKSLEKILEDKDKLKAFIKLLEDEGSDLNAV